MNFDFALLLVILTAVSGLIWAFDSVVLAPQRRRTVAELGPDAGPEAVATASRLPVLSDYAKSFFPIFLIVLLLRSFLVEPFRIPSGSMMPTLVDGDFILVNKFDYGIRLPVLNTKIYKIGEPARGDVVVFRYPLNPSIPFIKRIIGLPGDHIVYRDKTLYVNGTEIKTDPAGTYVGVGAYADETGASILREHLEGVDHDILIFPQRPPKDADIVIPKGQYFVMGDNRDNSMDSRYWGTVPEQNLIGKAFLIWMNWDGLAGGVDWKRIGEKIQ